MPETPPPDNQFRTSIAMKIITWGSIVIGIVGLTVVITGLVIARTDRTMGTNLVSDVFHSLLPVIAAWIGTVLAFYFGRENFESASRQINNLVNKLTPDVLKDIPVKQIMIDTATMLKFTEPGPAAVTLSDLTPCFDSNKDKSRLPIVDKNGKPIFIMHRDEYNALMQDPANGPKALSAFASYGLNEPKGFVLIRESSTLNEALASLKAHPKCQDVFITPGGGKDEVLTGWLTDSRILSFLEP